MCDIFIRLPRIWRAVISGNHNVVSSERGALSPFRVSGLQLRGLRFSILEELLSCSAPLHSLFRSFSGAKMFGFLTFMDPDRT